MIPIEIDSWTAPHQAEELIRLSTGKVVLELGTWQGYTAVAMAIFAKAVMTIDTHVGDKDTIALKGEVFTLPIFMSNVLKYNVQDKIVTIVGFTKEVLPLLYTLGNRFDMIFIDAGHYYEEVKTDTELSYLLLELGGTMSWHDYYNSPGVNQTVNETVEKYSMKFISDVDGLMTYQKELR